MPKSMPTIISMGKFPPEHRILTVRMDVQFLLPMVPGRDETEINGWTVEEVVDDWFKSHPPGSYHATRDSHRIGNSEKIVSWKVSETRS